MSLPGDRPQPRQQQLQLVRVGELRLEQAALRSLRLGGFGIKRDAHDAGLRRVRLQLQVEQLQQQLPVLGRRCRADCNRVWFSSLKLQE